MFWISRNNYLVAFFPIIFYFIVFLFSFLTLVCLSVCLSVEILQKMVYSKCVACDKRLLNDKRKFHLSSPYYREVCTRFQETHRILIPNEGRICASCHLILAQCRNVRFGFINFINVGKLNF